MKLRFTESEQKFSLGIVGLGKQGLEHLNAALNLQKCNQIRLIGVCDSDRSRGTYALQAGVPFFDRTTDLLDRKPSAIIVALPNHLHYSVASMALKRGIHVLKEKPFALSITEAEELRSLAEEHKVILRIAQQRAFHSFYQWLEKRLPMLGKIRHLEYNFLLNDKSVSWYSYKNRGGGIWNGLGWHGCWVLAKLLGNPIRAKFQPSFSSDRQNLSDVEDSAKYSALFIHGASAVLSVSISNSFKDERLIVNGEKGSICLTREKVNFLDDSGLSIDDFNDATPWSDCYVAQLRHFLCEVSSCGVPNVDAIDWEALQIHLQAWNMYNAADHGENSAA